MVVLKKSPCQARVKVQGYLGSCFSKIRCHLLGHEERSPDKRGKQPFPVTAPHRRAGPSNSISKKPKPNEVEKLMSFINFPIFISQARFEGNTKAMQVSLIFPICADDLWAARTLPARPKFSCVWRLSRIAS